MAIPWEEIIVTGEESHHHSVQNQDELSKGKAHPKASAVPRGKEQCQHPVRSPRHGAGAAVLCLAVTATQPGE